MKRWVWVQVIAMLSACSSSRIRDTGNEASDIDAAGVDTRGDDAGTQCMTVTGGPLPDLSLDVDGPANYDGPVVVTSNDGGGALELVSPNIPIGARVTVSGALATIPVGTTLWASIRNVVVMSQLLRRQLTEWTLRGSEHAAVIADGRAEGVPAVSASLTLLGVPVTVSLLCSQDEVIDSVTHTSCVTAFQYGLTVHGDSDLTLQPGLNGHVSIRGIEYVVWLVAAYSETLTMPTCLQDWDPPLGFYVVARAAQLADVLNSGSADGGGD